MGWKTSVLIADRPLKGDGAGFLESLTGVRHRPAGRVTIEEAFDPQGGAYLGSWRQSLVLFDNDLVTQAAEQPDGPLIERMFRHHGCQRLLAAQLDSATNHYLVAWWEDRRLLRRVGGCAEEGRYFDDGPPLAWEVEALAGYTPMAGKPLIWTDENGEAWTHDQLGEEVVMSALAQGIGVRPDAESEDFMANPVIRYQRAGIFSRWFPRWR